MLAAGDAAEARAGGPRAPGTTRPHRHRRRAADDARTRTRRGAAPRTARDPRPVHVGLRRRSRPRLHHRVRRVLGEAVPTRRSRAPGARGARSWEQGDELIERRILIVDDDPSVRKVFARALDRAGFDPTPVDGGHAALESIAADRPAAVLLDSRHARHLTESRCSASCVQIRRRAPSPSSWSPGRADMGDRVAGLEAGASDYVTKPVDPTELVARVAHPGPWRPGLANRRGADLARAGGGARTARADRERPARSRIPPKRHATRSARSPGSTAAPCSRCTTVRSTPWRGPAPSTGRSDRSLPGPTGIEIARRSRRGPWSWDSAEAPGGHQRVTSAFGPIVRNGVLVGVLVLTSDPSDPTSAGAIPTGQTLATAIEIAPAIAELLAVRSTTGIDLVDIARGLVDVLEHGRFRPVFQPIARIADGAFVGFEALTRFDDGRPPSQVVHRRGRRRRRTRPGPRDRDAPRGLRRRTRSAPGRVLERERSAQLIMRRRSAAVRAGHGPGPDDRPRAHRT